MNLGDAKYFDACIYTSHEGREQLRIAAILVAKAILGFSPDLVRRRDALMFQQELEKRPGALNLCIVVRKVWELGALARPGVEGIAGPMDQLEAVAKNVYESPRAGAFPWLTVLTIGALAATGGYFVWRSRRKRLPAGF